MIWKMVFLAVTHQMLVRKDGRVAVEHAFLMDTCQWGLLVETEYYLAIVMTWTIVTELAIVLTV
jgi:hypothetical protein